MPRLRDLPEYLDRLRANGQLREPDDGRARMDWETADTAFRVDASSNDYLGLGKRIVSRETFEQGLGARGGRETPTSFSVSRETVPRTFSETGSKAPAGINLGEGQGNPAALEPTNLGEVVGGGAALGAGASRLIHGTREQHLAVERSFARWVGVEAALLFSSGYAANVGALSALLGSEDVVVSDALNHASLIDGIRLSRAKSIIVPHLSLREVEKGLEAGASWVVVESYYSMDGDGPNLRELRRLCDRHGANLYVDEAHSLGVFGPAGAGLCAAAGIVPDVIMGAFGKAVGSHGAAVGGSATVRTWLYNRARAFVFSTAPSPIHASDLLGQIERTRKAEAERSRLASYTERLRNHFAEEGVELGRGTFGPILGIRAGSETRALRLAEMLRAWGILSQAIRPPTVPEGQSRVRLTLSASLSLTDIDFVANEVVRALAELASVE